LRKKRGGCPRFFVLAERIGGCNLFAGRPHQRQNAVMEWVSVAALSRNLSGYLAAVKKARKSLSLLIVTRSRGCHRRESR
jgi:hypothetical protein